MKRRMIDIGANMLDPMFLGIYHGTQKHAPDISNVMQRAWDIGLTHIIVTAGNLDESKNALDFVKKDSKLFCTVGVHPTRCNEFDQKESQNYLDELIKIAVDGVKCGKVVAVGECGLDYDRTQFTDKETQLLHFDKHFKLKIVEATNGLPMFLHNRGSTKDLYQILKKNRQRWNKAVVHSFSDSLDDMKLLLQLKGIYIGVNGCSLKTKENIETVKQIPCDRLMIETDAPWCGIKKSHSSFEFVKTHFEQVANKKHSEPFSKCVKGRCEPAHIIQVLEVMAEIKKMDVDELQEIIYQNTMNVFFPPNKKNNDTEEWKQWLVAQHNMS